MAQKGLYGIPYMGSKGTIAGSICANLPKAKHFYDLFGGGFAITHWMMMNRPNKYKHFHFNEIVSSTVDLIQDAISGNFSYDKFQPEWISRDDFFRRIDEGYVRICWSFGNGQRYYIFSEDIEPYKKSMHMAVVFDQFDTLAEEVLGFNGWPANVKTVKQRRFYLRQKIEYYRKTNIPKVLHQFLKEKQLLQLEQLEQLERLQQLQQLQRLQQLKQLHFYSKDYRDVPILSDSAIYCDIPYKGTAEYYTDFDHAQFFDWAATREFPVYISEYEIRDDRFECIYEIDKMSLLNNSVDSKKLKKERLYWNRK